MEKKDPYKDRGVCVCVCVCVIALEDLDDFVVSFIFPYS